MARVMCLHISWLKSFKSGVFLPKAQINSLPTKQGLLPIQAFVDDTVVHAAIANLQTCFICFVSHLEFKVMGAKIKREQIQQLRHLFRRKGSWCQTVLMMWTLTNLGVKRKCLHLDMLSLSLPVTKWNTVCTVRFKKKSLSECWHY